MTTFLKLFAIAFPVFLIIDLLWLGVIAREFYRGQLESLMRTDINWLAAFAFYIIFVAGIVFMAVMPALENQNFRQAWILGAVLGLVSYAAYDLTNLATLEGFPLRLVLVDLVWGTILTASISAITYQVWQAIH